MSISPGPRPGPKPPGEIHDSSVVAKSITVERDPHFIVHALNETNRLLAIIANALLQEKK